MIKPACSAFRTCAGSEGGQHAWSSQRHWHTQAEEFVYVVEGEVVLVTEGSEEVLHAGACAAFLPGDPDGHHLQNRSALPARGLEIGSANLRNDETYYPDVDLHASASGYFHKHRTPYYWIRWISHGNAPPMT